MLGLAVLGVFLIYILLCVIVVMWAVKAARKRGIKGWKWGVPAALFMYLIVFWDHIPTLIAHKYYCNKEAGFFVYKTLEQWKAENPGVAETLTAYGATINDLPVETIDAGTRNARNIRKINNRFIKSSEDKRINGLLPITKWTYYITDTVTNLKIAENINFQRGYGNPMTVGGKGSWKFWLRSNSCGHDFFKYTNKQFYDFLNSIIEMSGEGK